LAQTLQQSNAISVRVKRVYIVNDNEAITIAVELEVHSKCRRIPLDPACLVSEDCPYRSRFRKAWWANKDQEVDMPVGKSLNVVLQAGVGSQNYGAIRHSL
jgi:hypothetical protein